MYIMSFLKKLCEGCVYRDLHDFTGTEERENFELKWSESGRIIRSRFFLRGLQKIKYAHSRW